MNNRIFDARGDVIVPSHIDVSKGLKNITCTNNAFVVNGVATHREIERVAVDCWSTYAHYMCVHGVHYVTWIMSCRTYMYMYIHVYMYVYTCTCTVHVPHV
jgi:hypothetical protein